MRRTLVHYLDHLLLGALIFLAGYEWARLHDFHHEAAHRR